MKASGFWEVHSFRKCNVNSLLDDLSNAPWSTMDVFDTVDDKWSYWKTLFLKVVNKHAPIIRIRTCTKQHLYHWVFEEIRWLMQSETTGLDIFRKRRDPADWHAFRELRNAVKKRLRDDKQSYIQSLCKEMSAQSKRVWKELNAALGRKISKKIKLDIGSATFSARRWWPPISTIILCPHAHLHTHRRQAHL